MKEFVVDKKYDNKKLSTFFKDSFSTVPSSVFFKLLRKKDIRINDVRTNEDVLLHCGDKVKVFIQEKANYSIVYEDENVLVINKPTGIEVSALADLLKNDFKYIEPCHRLDRNTSGLVLFAKKEDSLKILLEAFKMHEIEKHYVCIVIR